MNKLTIEVLKGKFGVCQLDSQASIPTWCQQGEFYNITKTSDELSIVCLEDYIPSSIQNVEKAWCVLKIVGPLDFSLVGILAKISQLMADHHISIFALSTYDTDYILVKQDKADQAIDALIKAEYHVIQA